MKKRIGLIKLNKIRISLLMGIGYFAVASLSWPNSIGVLHWTNDMALAATTKRRSAASGTTLTTPTPKTPIEHNNRGVELGMKGLWEAAIREHEIALNADPENKEFRQNLSSAQMLYARQLASRGKIYEAMNHYRESLYVDPTNAEADHALDGLVEKTLHKNDLATRMNEADKADISGNYVTAIVEYRKCVMMSDTGPVMARLGRVLLKQGKTVDGYAELKAAVSKPWPDTAKNDLADCHRQLGELLKDHAILARDRGDLNTALKRLANSGVEYRRAVTLNPENSDAIAGLVEVAREAVSVKPSFDNHLMLGGAYQLAGDYDRAKMEYESCWRLEPNNSSLSVARRSFHLAVVSHPRSPAILASTMEKLENSIKETPDDPELLYIYGRGKEAQEDREGALKAYEAAAAINPLIFPDLKSRIASIIGGGASSSLSSVANSSGQSAANNTSLGSKNNQGQTAALASNSASTAAISDDMLKNLSTYAEIENKMRSNDLDGAEKIARQLVDKDPHNGKGWLLLGRIAEKKGELDSASVSYRQAADLKEAEAKDALNQIDSSRVQPMLQEAELASAKGNWVMAAADLKDAISLAPNLAIVHRKLAAVLKQLGDNKSAAKEAKKADELEKN